MEKSCGYVATRRILAVQNALGSQKFHDVSSILHSDFKLDAQKIILFCQDGRQSSLPDLSVQNINILTVCEKPITLAVVQLAHDTASLLIDSTPCVAVAATASAKNISQASQSPVVRTLFSKS